MRDIFHNMLPAPSTPFNENTPKVASATSSSASSTAGTTNLSIKTSSGSTINVDNYPTDLQKTILTLGANGTSKVLSDTILKLAEQQLAAGVINQEQYNTLVALSNQGHYLAEHAGAIQTAAVDSTDGTITPWSSYRGKPYPLFHSTASWASQTKITTIPPQ